MSLIRSIAAAALGPAFLMISAPASAGDDPRNYFELPDAVELDGVRIEFREVWAEEDYIKVKVKITNETADYIFFYKHEAEFDVGDLGKLKAHDGKKKKPKIIDPKKSKNHTWKVDGAGGFFVKGFELDIGGFYRVSPDGEVLEAPNFQLPAARNDFEAGPFKCKLAKKVHQETKETKAEFECRYSGDAIGWVDSASLGVKVTKASEDSKSRVEGMEFANNDKKPKKTMLKPGDTGSFAAVFNIEFKQTDMQFSVLHILWRNTFAESAVEPLDTEEVEFEWDEALTAEKAE
jgi:hypothetical protein